MGKKRIKLSDQVRRAVDASSMSRYGICKALDMDQAIMSRFMTGKGGLSMVNLDALADLLGLEIHTVTIRSIEMKPFSDYPDKDTWKEATHYTDPSTGKKCCFSDSGARRGYVLKLQIMTGQTACAYCGLNLVDCYEHWLLVTRDHVVPTKQAKAMGVRKEWREDYRNTVLACSACNGLKNKWKLPEGEPVPKSDKEFFRLRDKVFRDRRKTIKDCQKKERAFYDGKPWDGKPWQQDITR